MADVSKTKKQLIAENILLRQQLIVLNRQAPRAEFKPLDRFILVVLGLRQVSDKSD